MEQTKIIAMSALVVVFLLPLRCTSKSSDSTAPAQPEKVQKTTARSLEWRHQSRLPGRSHSAKRRLKLKPRGRTGWAFGAQLPLVAPESIDNSM
jgi:hypothetical protein